MLISRLIGNKSLTPWKFFLRDKVVFLSLLPGFFLNIILWVFIYIKIPHSDGLIAIHYNIYFGVDRFGHWYNFFLASGVGIVVLFLNFVLSYFFYKKDKFLSRLLAIAGLLAQIILISATAVVIWNYF